MDKDLVPYQCPNCKAVGEAHVRSLEEETATCWKCFTPIVLANAIAGWGGT